MKKFLLILIVITLSLFAVAGLVALKQVNDFNKLISDGEETAKIGVSDFFKPLLADQMTLLVLPVEAEKGTTEGGVLYTIILAKIDQTNDKVTTVELPLEDFVVGTDNARLFKQKIAEEYDITIDNYLIYNLISLVSDTGDYGDNLFDFSGALNDNLGELAPYEDAGDLYSNLGFTGTISEFTKSSKGLIALLGDNITTDLTILQLYPLFNRLASTNEASTQVIGLDQLHHYFK